MEWNGMEWNFLCLTGIVSTLTLLGQAITYPTFITQGNNEYFGTFNSGKMIGRMTNNNYTIISLWTCNNTKPMMDGNIVDGIANCVSLNGITYVSNLLYIGKKRERKREREKIEREKGEEKIEREKRKRKRKNHCRLVGK